jgi:formate hydrogenlyase transcriptional activator
MDVLTMNTWRGNVRELANFIERAVILSRGNELEVRVAELKVSELQQTGSASTFVEAQRSAILDALTAASGRIAGKQGAAERLGVKRTTLQNKMRSLGIAKAHYQ